MNRSNFYVGLRGSALFPAALPQSQVSGIEAILDEAERRGSPLPHVAYILATAYHESAHTMQPVRETLAKTDDGAIAALEKAWKAGKLSWVKSPYWRKDKDGKAWFGRGLVQITHKDNYAKFGLTDDPSKALEMSTAVRVIFDGMEQGLFTEKKLADYITDAKADYVNARRIVNGTDKAEMIAGYARSFESALTGASYGAERASEIPTPAKPATIEPQPIPDGNWLDALIKAIIAIFTRKEA